MKQGAVFIRTQMLKSRGATAVRRAVERSDAREAAREIADACPDDQLVISFLISALAAKQARLTDPLTAAVALSVEAGRLCPAVVARRSRRDAANRHFPSLNVEPGEEAA
jgi:hypothetical protein